jgi:hypothetical protein
MAELVETYANTMTWYSTSALGPVLALAAAYHGLFWLNSLGSWPSRRPTLLVVGALALALGLALGLAVWDFMVCGLTGMPLVTPPGWDCGAPRSALAYDMTFMANDPYDWHVASPTTPALRMGDVYIFFLQLVNIAAL